jgi:hypothetical protein
MSTGTLYWQFSMGTNIEPCWQIYQRRSHGLNQILVAYAKRAKDGGWFVRIGNVNRDSKSEKMYIDEHVFPPSFMTAMLHMTHTPPGEEEDDD